LALSLLNSILIGELGLTARPCQGEKVHGMSEAGHSSKKNQEAGHSIHRDDRKVRSQLCQVSSLGHSDFYYKRNRKVYAIKIEKFFYHNRGDNK
jgi:hypothetical protein